MLRAAVRLNVSTGLVASAAAAGRGRRRARAPRPIRPPLVPTLGPCLFLVLGLGPAELIIIVCLGPTFGPWLFLVHGYKPQQTQNNKTLVNNYVHSV